MSFVLDSSITLAWIYLDELTPSTFELSQTVTRDGAWVPAIWPLEIANSLQIGIRRHRIDVPFRNRALAELADLNIAIDQDTTSFAWTTTLELSDRFRLTPYDACYLELAQRRELPLATLDRDLRSAAQQLEVELLGA
jgi:predicted nucleic acid-binding protein